MRVTAMRAAAVGVLVATTSLVTFAAAHKSWRDDHVSAPAAPDVVVAEPIRLAASTPPPAAAPAPVAPPAAVIPAKPPAVVTPSRPVVAETAPDCPGNPSALGVARVVEIDTTGGPGFGFEHFKAYDFLKANEVVLTFDDGPWPNNTPAVLAALAAHCTKALFFPIGKHALWHPEILKQVAEAGHTIGSHTWSHADLSKKNVAGKDEIEKGISAVQAALGDARLSPFFRFPYLRQPNEMQTYLAERNIAIFSTDMDSFDFKLRKPEQVIDSVMSKLRKRGKGIILMHDFQPHTAQALPELLRQLQAGGYKVVQIKAKDTLKTLPQYDAMMTQEIKGGGSAARPISSVVRTIDSYGEAPPPAGAAK
jgi:peptidoglycan/xylan/chitin deacetylase (PgdA/CDA1 family)